jgi:hypothetical protein
MRYSVIFLVGQETDEFLGFFELICRLFAEQGEDFEVVVVANGTQKFVTSRLVSRKNNLKHLKVMAFQKKVGDAVCLLAALSECNGTHILTLSPFQELSSAAYQTIICSMTDEVDLVVPYRKLRKDAFLNRFHSRILNGAVRYVLGVKISDIGCGIKFFKREVLESLQLYGNMYKYFSALAAQKGFKIKEIECEQSEKPRKTSFYSLGLYWGRVSEILNLFFSTRFSRKPLRFFNLIGASLMLVGSLALFCVGIQKLIFDVPIGSRTLLMVGIMGLVGGTQIASFGLLGEIISFVYGRARKEYTIEKII